MPQSDMRDDIARHVELQLEGLAERGVHACGNACASVLLVKGRLRPDEKSPATGLLAGDDGNALRAALAALGYAPEDWAGLATVGLDGEPLEPRLLREAVTALDPATVVLLDEDATQAFREAYVDELAAIESLDEAMLVPGAVCHVMGMRCINVGDFEASLASSAEKQRSWAYLKRIPPMAEPF